jgi:hypothetical protein
LELAEHVTLIVETFTLEREDLRHGDDLAFHAVDLRHADHPPLAVFVAGDLDDQVNGRSNLLAKGLDGEVDAGHGHHVLDPAQGIPRGVGVDRGQRAVVAGVHGLEHVQRLAAAHLADDDPLRSHPQTVDYQVSGCNSALTLDVCRAGF